MTRIRDTAITILLFSGAVALPLIAAASSAPPVTGCASSGGGYCVNLASLTAAVRPVPGLEFLQIDPSSLGDLLSSLYVFGLGFIGIAALIMLTYGGIKYMVAGEKDPSEAKKYMRNAALGLALALVSWLILYVINPDLVLKLDLTLIDIGNVGSPQGDGTALTPPPTRTTENCAAIEPSQCGFFKNCVLTTDAAGTTCLDRTTLEQSTGLPFCNDATTVAASPGETPPCACKTPNLKPVLEQKFLALGSWNFWDLVCVCNE